jgi:hypothetical protein
MTKRKLMFPLFLTILASCIPVRAQNGATLPARAQNDDQDRDKIAVLEVEVANRIFYVADTPDITKFATVPNPVFPLGPGHTFATVIGIGDIVAVNGKPAKGTYLTSFVVLNMSPGAKPGQAIGDVTHSNYGRVWLEIQKVDGTLVGAISIDLAAGGPPPPGAPSDATGSGVVIGGTGAFLGARGQQSGINQVFGRAASITEDPSDRRIFGGGTGKLIVQLIRSEGMKIDDLLDTNLSRSKTNQPARLLLSRERSVHGWSAAGSTARNANAD